MYTSGVMLQVLDANPAHVNGLYRRGMAYMALGEFEEARNDFNAVINYHDFLWLSLGIPDIHF